MPGDVGMGKYIIVLTEEVRGVSTSAALYSFGDPLLWTCTVSRNEVGDVTISSGNGRSDWNETI